MTSAGRRGIPILDGAQTAVAAARVDVRPAPRSAFRRGLAQTFPPPPPDFPSRLAIRQLEWGEDFYGARVRLNLAKKAFAIAEEKAKRTKIMAALKASTEGLDLD